MPVVLTDLTINLQSKTISDTFTAQSVIEPTLGETITHTVLGQTFSFTVDDYNLNKETGRYDITGSYDIATKLNTDVDLSASLSIWAQAGSIIGALASQLGMSCYPAFSGFKPTGLLTKDSNNNLVCTDTYGALVQKIFGWTDIVPTTLINVFKRGNTLHCAQRGTPTGPPATLENNKCSNVSIKHKKMQLLYPSSTRTYYLVGDISDVSGQDSTDPNTTETYVSGTFTEGENTQVYAYGLLVHEAYESADGTKAGTTEYDYGVKIYPPANLVGKTSTQTETKVVDIPTLTESDLPYRVVTNIVNTSSVLNTFATNGSDLIKSVETITVTTQGYNITDLQGTQVAFPDEVETTITETRYSDMGQGKWSVVVYRNDVFVSSQVVTGNPGGKATPWAIKQNSTVGGRRNKVKTLRVQLSGRFTGNSQINVSDLSTLQRVAAAIESLNGKTEERVTLTYYGTAWCDFWNTVTFNGNAYYLERNSVHKTPSGTSQQLELVRWY